MAHLRKATNYIVSFLAILVSGALSWLGFQPPAWAARPAVAPKTDTAALVKKTPAKQASEPEPKKARKTAKAASRKTVARRSAPKSSARVKKAA